MKCISQSKFSDIANITDIANNTSTENEVLEFRQPSLNSVRFAISIRLNKN